MNSSEYKNIYNNESSHFYYLGYQSLIINLLKKYLTENKKIKILDVGCGTGYLTKQLEQFGEVVGVDSSPKALRYATKRGINVTKASIQKLPFKNSSFDLIVSIDVLYHKSIKNDYQALKEIYRILKPNGLFLIKLPAFNILYGNHDLMVHAKKRYNKKDLELLFKISKMKPLKITYLGTFLFFPVLIKTLIEKLTNNINLKSSVRKVWPPFNSLLTFLFKVENISIKSINLPFGISILAIAKK